ncbi:prephenate dehydrogenase/arogenate dehydrogenase family protein [bacterium]|nr:prephenate dehydrogenase/arogenate dehydrogenase family protein [bacterium]
MKIGIVSLGLIGGSLFKCLCNSSNEIYAVTRNKETIEKAKKYSINVSDDINTVKGCDVVFVASPISKTVETLDELEKILSKDTIVLDCASVKEFVMNKKYAFKFIGSHPMAGTEFNGFDASFETLFEGAKWVLTPCDDTEEKDINIVREILEFTGAKTIIASAKEHDEAVALISHMPMLVSQSIFNVAKDNELAMKLAASGFRDMTRLSMSNPQMASDMLFYNGRNIDKSIEMLKNSIKFLKSTKYMEKCVDIKNTRSKMYSVEGKNTL